MIKSLLIPNYNMIGQMPPSLRSNSSNNNSHTSSQRILRRGSPLTRTTTPNWLGNPNVDWLHFRGTWLTNVLIAITLRGLFATVPGISNEAAWTLTNLTYNIVPHHKGNTFYLWCGSLRFSFSIGFVALRLILIRMSTVP